MMDKTELLDLPRKKLQALAKKHGIKANLASNKMVDELLKVMDTNDNNEPVKKKAKTSNKVEKKAVEEVKDEKVSVKKSLKSSSSSSGFVEIPLYWGSVLEGASDPKSTYEQAVSSTKRVMSLSMFCEPYVMQLFHRAGAVKVSRDAVAEAKKILVEMIAKTCSSLKVDSVPQKGKKKAGKNADIGREDIQAACYSWGFHMFGAKAIHAASCPYINCNTSINEKFKEETKEWDVFCHALSAIGKMQVENVYTLLEMKKLTDTGRADVADVSNPSVIARACTTLDSYVFRYLLSFVASNPRKTKFMKSNELFSDYDDIADNWDSDVDHFSLEEALKENVDVLKAEDDHTGATLLHALAVRNKAEDCQKLIEMGMDIEVTTGDGFENGDGWGELEYTSFKALHFACSNGHVDVARVLLRNGACVDVHAGWDGGYFVPVVRPGSDYFYTSQNTPLHQAARGNHANIIHLLMDGPDEESKAYAAAKGIDLSEWENIDIEDSSPSIDTYNEEGMEEISFNVTPLGMAIIFGNLDAALALLQHGADLNNISDNGKLLKRITHFLLKKGGKFKELLKDALDRHPHADAEIFWKCGKDDSDDSDDEDVEPWEKEDWNERQVPEGDMKVLIKDDEEDDDDLASAGFLPADECVFAQSVIKLLEHVHPDHHMSKNCQLVMSDFFEYIMNSMFRLIVSKHQSNLTQENIVAVIPSLVAGELVKFAISECSKTDNALFEDVIKQHLDKHFPSIKVVDNGLGAASKVIEYCTAELLELAGNLSRDRHLKCIHPDHVFNIDDDELEACFFRLSSYGTAVRSTYKNCVVKQHGIFTEEKENNDYFNLDWIEDKHIRSSVSEFMMSVREFRMTNNTSMYGVSILPSAFQVLLEEQCRMSNEAVAGRFSEEGLLAVQVVCESILVDIVSKATTSWKAKCEETDYNEFPFVTGEDIKSAYAEAVAYMQSRVEEGI
jgi:ankyrin repeat protein